MNPSMPVKLKLYVALCVLPILLAPLAWPGLPGLGLCLVQIAFAFGILNGYPLAFRLARGFAWLALAGDLLALPRTLSFVLPGARPAPLHAALGLALLALHAFVLWSLRHPDVRAWVVRRDDVRLAAELASLPGSPVVRAELRGDLQP